MGRLRTIAAVLAVTGILGACATPTAEPAPKMESPAAGESELTVDELMNMTYTMPDGTEITLRDGVYQERPSPDSATFIANYNLAWNLSAFGDLTGDGRDDGAAILIDAPGGSGTFTYLAAVTEEAGMPVNVSTTMLGDRVDIKDHVVLDLESRLTVVTHGPDDPMCCPTEQHAWGFSLRNGQLVQSSDELLGSIESED